MSPKKINITYDKGTETSYTGDKGAETPNSMPLMTKNPNIDDDNINYAISDDTKGDDTIKSKLL
ncbi:18453_t:CDS:2 [Racocetra fulgida]|uniref:18453_t:CDS:1 n=1 Tax=Racocetra fulgida TaxID=60492 RepID=A0A9N9A5L5_9GLOM|nr:18453_t:CDS:2 [Racocetra fulgida]